MDDDKVWSGFSMKARRNVARVIATVLGALIVLVAAQQGTALAAGPELTIQPFPGNATDNQMPTFTGTTNDQFDVQASVFDPVTLDIYEGPSATGTPLQVWTTPVPGVLEDTWEITPASPLEQGEYTAVVEQTSAETGSGTSLPVTFRVETRPVVTLASPTEHAVLKSSKPTLSGEAGTAAWDGEILVLVHEGGSTAGKVIASEDVSVTAGTWSYAPQLSDGVYTAQAVQEDEVGDAGASVAVTFTVNANAPAVTLTSPAQGAVLNTPNPPLGGRAGTAAWDDPSVTVTVHEGSSTAGRVVASESALVSGGAWAWAPHLSDGVYTAQASQGDEAGGEGTSGGVTFTVDANAPVVTLTSPAENAVLNTSSATLSGSAGAAAWDDPSVTVKLHEGSSTSGKIVLSESVSVSGGVWSFQPHLNDGVYTAQATQGDEGGNTGTSTPAVTFTVNANRPPVTLTSPGAGAVVGTSNPTLAGGAGAASWDHPSVTVTVYEGGSTTGHVVVSENVTANAGTWSYSPHLSDGVYTAQAAQADEAGETGTSAAMTFTVDATTPIVSIGAVPPLTNDATPTLTGGAETEPWDNPFVTVTIQEGTRPVLSERASVIAGVWSYTTPHLADGSYSVQVSQGDEAGHTGTSGTATFTIDTTKPAVSLTKPANQADLTVSEPVFSGLAGHATGDEPAVTLKIYEAEGGAASETPVQEVKNLVPNAAHEWTTGSIGPRLSNGIYVAVAEQVDEAGNTGKSKATTFTIATRSPEVTLDTTRFVQRGPRLLTGPSPSFNGTGATEPEDGTSVSVNIYAGTSASGIPVRSVSGPLNGSSWATLAVGALEDGTYTVQAEQADANPFSQTGVSNTVTFTVDANPPNVTLTTPANGSATTNTTVPFSGAAGTNEGDLNTVTVQLYSGSAIGQQAPLEGVTVPAAAGWSAALGGLSPGTYTAQAEQRDDVGNVGRSEAVTFTVVTPPALAITTPSPPVASFKWIPADPQAGEPVTLASSSSAGSSPIANYAWALAGNGVFTHGESTLTTLFATPGLYTVQLQVTDADGLSSTVAEKLAVTTAPVPLMQPFPVVRMAGSFSGSGARLTLLAALAPVGAKVTITCHGKGCPTKSQAFVAAAGAKSKSGTVQITFKRFERFLRGGVVLEIWISKHGQIGKFTRFVIHGGKSPTRVDECLNSAGTTPIVCPS
jgi:hypothetical protein